MTIKSVVAREILDSRGNPTVEVDILTEKGLSRASVPSGASTGIHEALELRDGNKRYLGKGVLKAVENINKKIAPTLLNKNPFEQGKLDDALVMLDGTENKKRLGANAILAVSIALCKAGALEKGIPLYKHIANLSGAKRFIMPVPSFNILNGGQHAGNALDIQEYMILPIGAKNFADALRMGSETYHILKEILEKKYGKTATAVGDEGGFAPAVSNPEDPLKLIVKAIDKAGYTGKIKIGMDAAASEFYNKGKYKLNGKILSSSQLSKVYEKMINNYPLVSIEDPFDQDDWKAWEEFSKSFGRKVQIVGDDLLVTNSERIQKAIHHGACNALLLKVNQIGSITESIEAYQLAKDNGWNTMVSHRSGETSDYFIADLVVGLGNGQIKSGAPCRGERTAKYNQLLRIEEELGGRSTYAGKSFKRLK